MEGGGRTLRAHRPPRAVIWGGKSQAMVIRSVLGRLGTEIVAVFDDTPGLPPPFDDVPLLAGSSFETWALSHGYDELGFVVAVGNPNGRARLKIHQRLAGAGLVPVTVVDPHAFIDPTAELGPACQVYAGAVVSAYARLGAECIVNCQALIEHEVVLEDGVEVAPAAAVLGLAHVGACATIGVHATVLARVRVGADTVIGAGQMIGEDLPASAEAFGERRRIF